MSRARFGAMVEKNNGGVTFCDRLRRRRLRTSPCCLFSTQSCLIIRMAPVYASFPTLRGARSSLITFLVYFDSVSPAGREDVAQHPPPPPGIPLHRCRRRRLAMSPGMPLASRTCTRKVCPCALPRRDPMDPPRRPRRPASPADRGAVPSSSASSAATSWSGTSPHRTPPAAYWVRATGAAAGTSWIADRGGLGRSPSRSSPARRIGPSSAVTHPCRRAGVARSSPRPRQGASRRRSAPGVRAPVPRVRPNPCGPRRAVRDAGPDDPPLLTHRPRPPKFQTTRTVGNHVGTLNVAGSLKSSRWDQNPRRPRPRVPG